MSFEEITKAIKAALYDRAKSPFYATFIISWLVWNWRVVYYIFGEDENKNLLSKIDHIKSNYADININLWHPLWTSLVVFILGTLLTMGFRFLQIYFSNIRKEKIEGLEMLSKNESTAAKKELVEYESRINTTSLDLKRRLEGVETQYASKLKELEDAKTLNTNQQKEIDKLTKGLTEFTEKSSVQNNLSDSLVLSEVKEINGNSKNFDTIDSEILKAVEGSIFVWAKVTTEHNQGTRRYMYILSHAGRDGQSIDQTEAKYSDAWSISVFRDINKTSQWRFWATNAIGEGGNSVLKSQKRLDAGWHLFGVTWTKNKFIKYYIDKKKVGESLFEFWPENIQDVIYVGTWPNTNRAHYFDSSIGPIYTFRNALSQEEIIALNDINPNSLEATQKNLTVIAAQYGTDENTLDMKRELSKLIINNRLEFVLTNEIAGDPSPGKPKKLKVTYEINGERQTRAYDEGAKVVIQ